MADQTVNELKATLKESLEDRGVLQQVRAQIRKEIFDGLNDKEPLQKPSLDSKKILINELIREYLITNGLHHTLSVFLPESGQPEQPAMSRQQITKQLKIVEDKNSQDAPLLYGLAFGLKSNVNMNNTQDFKKQNNFNSTQEPGLSIFK